MFIIADMESDYKQTFFMESDEQPQQPLKKQLKPTDMVYVHYRGHKMPIRFGEMSLFNKLSRKEKNEMLAAFKRSTRKGFIVKAGTGYVTRKFASENVIPKFHKPV